MNEQLKYVFDAAGNLNYRTNNALVENFQVNSVNELTANTNGGTLTVMGTTTSPATSVAVNGTTASNYNDATFAATNMPLTTTYTATASDSLGRHSTNTVTVNITNNNTAFQYDGNGNLTSDGLRSFAYDNENQLIQVQVTNQWLSQFTYDGKMRRRIRVEYSWQGGKWIQTNLVYYVYDGKEVIQERNANNLPAVTYTRGKDLSGGLEEAGGIGGLLARTDMTSEQPAFYHGDANGNVTILINSSNAVVAKYLYDAFGNTISKSGLLADVNLYRFSSKEAHPNSGLVYYLYRYYDPHLQRWPNRDPIGEKGFELTRRHHSDHVTLVSPRRFGRTKPHREFPAFGELYGQNAYLFLRNRTVNLIDPLGLMDEDPDPTIPIQMDPNDPNFCENLMKQIEDTTKKMGTGNPLNYLYQNVLSQLWEIWYENCDGDDDGDNNNPDQPCPGQPVGVPVPVISGEAIEGALEIIGGLLEEIWPVFL